MQEQQRALSGIMDRLNGTHLQKFWGGVIQPVGDGYAVLPSDKRGPLRDIILAESLFKGNIGTSGEGALSGPAKEEVDRWVAAELHAAQEAQKRAGGKGGQSKRGRSSKNRADLSTFYNKNIQAHFEQVSHIPSLSLLTTMDGFSACYSFSCFHHLYY